MPDAFISYSRSDSRDFVERLAAALEAAGKDVWVDLEDIPPASRWQEALQDGVLGSDAFLFVISPGALASDHCRAELEHAGARNKRIIPVAQLEVADADLPAAVASLNWVPQTGGFADDFDGSLKTLIEAIETDQEAVQAHTRWQRRAEGWRSDGEDRSLLARGAELAEAEAWLTAQAGRDPRPTALQAEWVAAGRQAARRRQGFAFAAVGVGLLVAAVLGVIALAQRNQARDQRDAARAGELASDAVANLEVDPELSLILALEAARTDASPRSEQTLERALLASHVRLRVQAGAGERMDGVALSADGELIATGDSAGAANVWDAASGDSLARFEVGDAGVGAVAFTPDSKRLLVAGGDGVARIFEVRSERRLVSVRLAGAALDAIATSSRTGLFAAGGLDGTVAVCDLEGSDCRRLAYGGRRVNSVAFTPDGSGVLSASNEQVAVLRDADDGTELLTLSGSGGPTGDAQISPDGRYIATANHDGSAVLWSSRTGKPVGDPLVAVNRAAVVFRVAFVPGANAVLTAGGGGEVDAWDLDTRERVGSYRGHLGGVTSLAAGSDGQRIATAGLDGSARIWDFGQRLYTVRSPSAVKSVEFSRSGRRLVIADGRALIVDAETGERLGLVDLGDPITSASISPDGTRLATAGTDGLIRIWDLDSERMLGSPLRLGDSAFAPKVAWSADGSRLMAADPLRGVTVWASENGALVGHLKVSRTTFDAALSPDGERLAIVTADPEVGIYDVAGGDLVATLAGHTDQVSTVAYDPSGTRLVTASEDGTARVWVAASASEELVLANDGQAVRAAAFNADGSLLATTSAAGELRLWDASSGLELSRVEGANWKVALSPGGELIAGALAQTPSPKTSVYECDVCGSSLEQLEALAERRITREATSAERRRYSIP